MESIPLQTIPNQSFTIVLDNNTWAFTIKNTNAGVSVSLTLNNNDLLDNAIAAANEIIIPCEYQEAGNFLFLTQNQQLPDYTQFGLTQLLVYLSASDLQTLRTPPGLPITAIDFNALAALPLRFAPMGYTLA